MFGTKQVVVTLERDGLLVDNLRWAYPPGTVLNQEVLDPTQFLQAWTDYWAGLGHKRAAVVILLSEPLLFSKISDREELEFWDQVPIDKKYMARKVIYEGGKVTMLATNRELFSLVVQGIETSKAIVRAVVPANFATDNESLKVANFLNEVNNEPNKKSNHALVWFLVGGVWVGVIILIWLKIAGKI